MRQPDVVADPDAGVLGAIAGDAPTAGRDAPFEAFINLSDSVSYRNIGGSPDQPASPPR
jgi:hypothetical protein